METVAVTLFCPATESEHVPAVVPAVTVNVAFDADALEGVTVAMPLQADASIVRFPLDPLWVAVKVCVCALDVNASDEVLSVMLDGVGLGLGLGVGLLEPLTTGVGDCPPPPPPQAVSNNKEKALASASPRRRACKYGRK